MIVGSLWLDSLLTHYKASYPAGGKIYFFLAFISYILILPVISTIN